MATHRLRTPVYDASMLRVGDTVYIDGFVFTARDRAHRLILDMLERGESLPFDPRGLVLYHCGPVARRTPGGWEILSAGPTTSTRMEPLEPRFLEATGVRLLAGKGGVGPGTREALRRLRGAYLVYPGGAAVLAAEAVEEVVGVYWFEELGMADAVWLFRVKGLGPMVVAADAHGGYLYSRRPRVEEALGKALRGLRALMEARL